MAFNLVLSDRLQAYSIFPPVEKSLLHQGLFIMIVFILPTVHMHNTIPEIPTLPIWSGVSRFDVFDGWWLEMASRSPDFYQILPIYHKILKTRGKLLIFRIFGDLSLWNTHIILTFFAKSIMVCYNSGRNDVKIQEMALERT